MPISQKIQEIIDERQNVRLPIIRQKREFIDSISQVIKQLKEFRDRLLEQERQGVGELLHLVEHAPSVAATIKELDLISIDSRIEKLSKELQRLEHRFSRECIQIAMVGIARKGKSKFLQSVANLGDDVIPTSSATDCTGAISIIENYEGDFRMEIEYHSLNEFLSSASITLSDLLGENIILYSLDDLKKYVGDKRLTNSNDNPVITFYNDYIKHVDNYKDCFSPNAQRLFTEKSRVIEYVAKYRIFEKGELIPDSYNCYDREIEGSVTKVLFNKFVAVKCVNIKTHFGAEYARKLVMVDTIGLGNRYTGEADEQKMHEVLRDETDAAIYNLFIPAQGVNAMPKIETDIIDKLYDTLKDYSPERWISLNINHLGRGEFKTDALYDTYMGAVKSVCETARREKYGKGDDKRHLAYCMYVDNADAADVKDNMLMPVLNIIKDNINEIDQSFMVQADAMAKALYYEYHSICEQISTVVNKMKRTYSKFDFDDAYSALTLRYTLVEYVKRLYNDKDKPCDAIISELKPQIDNLISFVPTQDEIAKFLKHQDAAHADIAAAYNYFLGDVRAKILSQMKNVSARAVEDVQKKVQRNIAGILYNEGLLNKFKLKSISNQESTIDWMRAFEREKLNGYEVLSPAFKSVVDFRMNIEGFLYAKCIEACYSLQKKKYTQLVANESSSIEEQACAIRDEIRYAVKGVRDELRDKFGLRIVVGLKNCADMSMPNILMWCMVDVFVQELFYTKGGKDLKHFYKEYQDFIWQNEIVLQDKIGGSIDEVMKLASQLQSYQDINIFKIIQ